MRRAERNVLRTAEPAAKAAADLQDALNELRKEAIKLRERRRAASASKPSEASLLKPASRSPDRSYRYRDGFED